MVMVAGEVPRWETRQRRIYQTSSMVIRPIQAMLAAMKPSHKAMALEASHS